VIGTAPRPLALLQISGDTPSTASWGGGIRGGFGVANLDGAAATFSTGAAPATASGLANG